MHNKFFMFAAHGRQTRRERCSLFASLAIMKTRCYHFLIVSFLILMSLQTLAQVALVTSKGALDEKNLAAVIVTVEPYIKEWPPRFTDRTQQSTIIGLVTESVQQLSTFRIDSIRNQHVLTDLAYLYAMAHNVDLDTADKAKTAFERAIAMNPNDRRTNYLFGMFLISTRAYHYQSLPYLQKSLELGEKDAQFSIGILLVQRGEKEKGLAELEAYLREHPESQHTRRVIQAAKNGELTFHER
jgi:tetratricopeptide (TPR) repeat protein